MTVWVGLLRAVNVGGTGKLPMKDLKALCEKARFKAVRTYIASGNVIFESEKAEAEIKTVLEASLADYAGKPMAALLREAGELAKVLARNPFPDAPSNLTVAIFLDKAPPKNALKSLTGQNGEEVALGAREIYVRYPHGIGQSKLKIPGAELGTARNMNTVAKLVELTGAG